MYIIISTFKIKSMKKWSCELIILNVKCMLYLEDYGEQLWIPAWQLTYAHLYSWESFGIWTFHFVWKLLLQLIGQVCITCNCYACNFDLFMPLWCECSCSCLNYSVIMQCTPCYSFDVNKYFARMNMYESQACRSFCWRNCTSIMKYILETDYNKLFVISPSVLPPPPPPLTPPTPPPC